MPADLATSSLLEAAAFHMLSAPDLAQKQVKQLLEMRIQKGFGGHPILVWEPLPGSCKREMAGAHLSVAKLVDVFSPNHLECLSLFSDRIPPDSASGETPLNRREVQRCADLILESGVGRQDNGAVVIRAGGDGCLVSSKSIPGTHKWLPPLHRSRDCIIDATGAGNTFLGALAFALQRGEDIVQAAMTASVATSTSVEQIGLPTLTQEDGEEERWNGRSLSDRWLEYQLHLGSAE